MRIVAAPNPFKGSLGAPAAAAAIAAGVLRVFPGAEVLELPVADGGEGTVEALVAAHAGELVQVEVEGPLGDSVLASFGLIDEGRTAVVELASSSGLTLVAGDRRDAGVSSTYGFGQLLAAARGRGVTKIIAGIGGSATNDGGAGMAQALGFSLLDDSGRELRRGGSALAGLDRIEPGDAAAAWKDLKIQVACDVSNPLTGPEGASAVYGPQKGAGPAQVAELDAALGHFAAVLERDLSARVSDLPGAGAAGGTGAGLVAFLGAELTRGAPLVVDASGLPAALVGASLVITGEGRVDRQTAYGKGPAEVAHRARAAGVPVILLAGSLGEGWEGILAEGVAAVEPLAEGPCTLEEMETGAAALLESAASRVCRLLQVTLS